MAGYYVPLPGAEVRNSLVDFSPINNGLNAVRDQNNQNRNALMQQRQLDNADKRLSMDQESHAQNMKTSGLDYQTKLAQRSAGIAQMIQAEKDPMRKAQLTERMYSMHPDYKANLQSAGLDPNDHDGVANFVIAQARGYVDPIEQQTKQAQLGLIKAQTNAANRRDGAKLMEVNGRIVRVAPNGQAAEVYNSGPDQSKLPQGYTFGKPGPNGEVTYQAIPGGPHDPSKPTAAVTTSAAQAKQAYDSLISELDNYNALVQNNGVAVLPGVQKDQLLQSRRDIQLQAKELYNLGVLNGPDLMLMDQLLPNASINSPLDITNAYDTQNRVKTGVATLKEKFRSLANSKLQSAQMPTIPEPQGDQPKLAPDGNWYVPDPARPGKYLKVQH